MGEAGIFKKSGDSRLLFQTQEKGTFLVRDDPDGSRQILSFLSSDAVCHVYVDHTEYLCKLGTKVTTMLFDRFVNKECLAAKGLKIGK